MPHIILTTLKINWMKRAYYTYIDELGNLDCRNMKITYPTMNGQIITKYLQGMGSIPVQDYVDIHNRKKHRW
jgi:hypothetical protein